MNRLERWPLTNSILLWIAKALTIFGGYAEPQCRTLLATIGFSSYHQVELPAEASVFGRQELRGTSTEPPKGEEASVLKLFCEAKTTKTNSPAPSGGLSAETPSLTDCVTHFSSDLGCPDH